MKPNVLFLMVDELRAPMNETPEIKAWRKEYLKTQTYLEERGTNFLNHYTSSTGCVPGRANLMCGQYNTLIKTTQTEGIAKSINDVFWLDRNNVPTMGDYFCHENYLCLYKGKVHFTNQDIYISGSNTDALLTYDQEGVPNKNITKFYEMSNRLKDFGFEGYVGPMPIGVSALNSGGSSKNEPYNGRDTVYTEEVINILKTFEKENFDEPWFVVASLVNPHDIALYGELTKRNPQFNFEIDPSVPFIPQSPTANENLDTKPRCQAFYRDKLQEVLQPVKDSEEYRKLYYSLNLQVDRNHWKIIETLRKSRYNENTIIVFVSDHAELLGSHGGLFQKWYNAYEESIKIPFLIKVPRSLGKQVSKVKMLTSNVDLLPTLLGLCNIDQEKVLKKLKKTHINARRLVGRDLSKIILGKEKEKDEPILFLTNDDPFKGKNQVTWSGEPYTEIQQPCNIRTVIVKLNGITWKYSEYFDDPDFWTTPNVQNLVKIQRKQRKEEDNILVEKLIQIIRTNRTEMEFEMYNLTEDPIEAINLANFEDMKCIQKELRIILYKDAIKKFKIPFQNKFIPQVFPSDVNPDEPLPKNNIGF